MIIIIIIAAIWYLSGLYGGYLMFREFGFSVGELVVFPIMGIGGFALLYLGLSKEGMLSFLDKTIIPPYKKP